MTSETQVLSEEMEKLLNRTYQDFRNTLVELHGNLKDIECGTHIRIPVAAGYVNYYKLENSFKVSLWLSDEMLQENQTVETQQQL